MRAFEIPLEPEKTYHIYNRTNGMERLFIMDNHYLEFLQKYKLYIAPIVETYAYCLIPNHFHLLVKVKPVEEIFQYLQEMYSSKDFSEVTDFREVSKIISHQFGNLFSSYSQWFNKKMERKGALFMPNFKRKIVEDPFYFTQLVAYIHTNPIKHGLTTDLYEWTYSSFHAYASFKSSQVKTDIILDFFIHTIFNFKRNSYLLRRRR